MMIAHLRKNNRIHKPNPKLNNLSTTLTKREPRFLGKKLTNRGHINGNFENEVRSDIKARAEGTRIKFFVSGNSLKAYNKQGNVFRAEATINIPEEFKVSRPKENYDQRNKYFLPMRRGITDLERRTRVSQECNDRFLDAQAQLNIKEPLEKLIDNLCQPTVDSKNKRVRALNPWGGGDAKILAAVNKGEFLVNGFRNKDIRRLLFNRSDDKAQQKRDSSKVTRLFRILRSHGLIKKVPHTHRYMVTAKGQRAISAIISARKADVDDLCKLAS